MRHPLIPIGAVVAIGWIVALVLAVRGHGARNSQDALDAMDALGKRMCDCSTLACVEEVEQEVVELGRVEPGEGDQLELFGAEQQLKACKREVMRKQLQ